MPAIVPNGNSPNQYVNLTSGTTDAERPQLTGQVIHDGLIPATVYGFYDGAYGGSATASLQARVVRSDSTGLLDFYYRAILTSGTVVGLQFGVGWLSPPSGTKVTYADYRPDGVGTAAPYKFVFGANGLGFTFEWPAESLEDVSTRFVFVSTNATEFAMKSAYFTWSGGFYELTLPCPSVV